MLVLIRRLNRSIMVGDIEVTGIEVRGDQVRLGVHAPQRRAGTPQKNQSASAGRKPDQRRYRCGDRAALILRTNLV